MVKIRKGARENLVAKSAFDNFFKNQGWELVGEEQSSPSPVIEEEAIEEPTEQEEDWDEVLEDEAVEEDIEKPLSEMNKEELINKAVSLGLDISDCTSNKQIREKIRASK